jgi:hypothetical protein
MRATRSSRDLESRGVMHPEEINVARPGPVPEGVLRRFTRGREHPRGVVWFGASSFWGHLRHFVASAIATENVDCRDWMMVDEPDALMARIAEVLGGEPGASSLTRAMGRDVFIDFVADTGDDTAVSRAVARLLFAPYELPDPDRPGQFLFAPRGDILCFGGDTAYPVATAHEIMLRVIQPYNQVLADLPNDGRRRVLIGLPGNHDWYDGLDGFGRMFRRRAPGCDAAPSLVAVSRPMLEQHARWAREFVRGGTIDKPGTLVLAGYTPVQNASYFALTLAPHLELLGVDRQLTAIDSHQQQFLGDHHRSRPDSAVLLLLPDPVYHFGVPSKTGTLMIENLHLDLATRETFILSGDIHHYERIAQGKVLQVIAGGGGAFLHPARIAAGGLAPRVAWPGIAQSRSLLRQIPWKLALGRSGFLPHFGLLILFLLALLLSTQLYMYTGLVISVSLLMTLLLGVVYALIGGVLRRWVVLPFAFGAALVTVMIPVLSTLLVDWALAIFGPSPSVTLVKVGALVLMVFPGTFVFGAYLSLLTLLGYENMQAFAVLDHPGFKHFVRLRVRADGGAVDAWCIGLADPLGPDSKPVLVDHFTWRPRREGCREGE